MNEVILLTREDCHFCEQAKAVLQRLEADYELRVRQLALETEEGGRLGLASGAPFPPVVLLNGRPFSYGRLSERKLRKALG